MSDFDLNFPRAWGSPPVSAGFRTEPEDFQVDEDLGFIPDGEGEHWLVQVRKRGDNTAWVAGQLARLAGISIRDVGYCGMKDRRAVTSQWFSLYRPKGPEPDWSALDGESITLLRVARHNRKLRRGQHRANHFAIRLRSVTPLGTDGLASLESRLQTLFTDGLPNYFGEQRFGREAGNLTRAQAWLVDNLRIRDRQQRAMAMSAARSWLFNQVLAERVTRGDWQAPLPGEPLEEASGPLWGRGRPLVSGEALEREASVLAPWQPWCAGLEHVGLNQERRALRLRPEGLAWEWEGLDLWLRFSLPPGTFATAVLRELSELSTSDAETIAQ